MINVKVRKINDTVEWGDMVGTYFELDSKKILFYEWENSFKKLKISIDIHGNNGVKTTEHISLALGEERFLDRLKNDYGVEVEFVNSFLYSDDTFLKVAGLIQAGFKKLIFSEGVYMVDNIFPQTFLKDSELSFLLENKINELELEDIKNY